MFSSPSFAQPANEVGTAVASQVAKILTQQGVDDATKVAQAEKAIATAVQAAAAKGPDDIQKIAMAVIASVSAVPGASPQLAGGGLSQVPTVGGGGVGLILAVNSNPQAKEGFNNPTKVTLTGP